MLPGVILAVIFSTLAAIAFVLSLIALAAILLKKRRGLLSAILAFIITVPMVGVGAEMLYGQFEYPLINDITTDTQNPPMYWAAPVATNYGGAAVAQQQRQSYPDIVPLHLSTPPDTTYNIALSLIRSRGWQILGQRPEVGEVEAVAYSRLFGFADDIVIRITPDGTGSILDMRSRSRVGEGDLGVNAARIEAFLDDMRSDTGN
ncbi:hypothetical protein GCM10007094_36600 [Pseudovibrio japonicus]|uniref:DUF1499 domain-containing protein n=1 Tax=Pseudovibrio japonicus TaxID=366534 RepID=A0ABQ3ERM1_9HYPH|nr:hypothetical protein GCM10007094_36600 [Pseudovibrio japonicus]